jgi:hypothetical protein
MDLGIRRIIRLLWRAMRLRRAASAEGPPPNAQDTAPLPVAPRAACDGHPPRRIARGALHEEASVQLAFYAAGGVAAAIALAAPAAPKAAAAPPATRSDSVLAARIDGTWAGHRSTLISLRPQRFTMSWRTAPDGHLTGTVIMPGERRYPVNVVWASDTAFIYESAPHVSRVLHERVVTRGLVHFKGDQLAGTFDARPTKYTGRTLTGSFNAVRSS